MRTVRIRRPGWWLAAAVTIPFAAAIFLGSSHAQGPRGPSSPFGPPPTPPPFGGGSGFTPPNIPGAPPNFGGPPNIPSPPSDFGRPPKLFEHVFTCSNCGKELGRSDHAFDKPPYDKCPFCGVTFINGGGAWSRPGSTFKPSDGAGQTQPPPGNNQGGFPPGNTSPPNTTTPANPFSGFGSSTPLQFNDPASLEARESSLGTKLLVAGIIVVGGLLGIGGLILLIVILSRAGSSSGRRKKARRLHPEERDDFDDEEEVPAPTRSRVRVRRFQQ